jgi:hypothetical protein
MLKHLDKIFLLFIGIFFTCTTSYAQKEFWGTVKTKGEYGNGYLFRTTSTGDDLEIIHHFQSALTGRLPTGIIQASNGKIYGLTTQGGLGNNGTLYEYDLKTDSLQILVSFDTLAYKRPDGQSSVQLIEGLPGLLYGQTYASNQLFVYNITNKTISFLGSIPAPKGPNEIRYPMHLSSNGFLYASTHDHSLCSSSSPRYNAIIRINPSTGILTTLYQNPCSSTDGLWYATPFVEQSTDEWYGIAEEGGISDEGVIFSFNPTNNTYTKKHDFEGNSSGGRPNLPLIKASNGKIYGTALRGAPDLPNFSGGSGIIFEYDPTTNIYQKKHDFRYENGSNLAVGREGVLKLKASNDKLYGASRWGVFEYNTETNTTRAAGRFGAGMAADNSADISLIEICRPPAYKYYAQTAYARCEGASFTLDLLCTNATSVVWKRNGATDPTQTTPVLSFENISPADTGTWVCELTNECGTTLPPPIQLTIEQENPIVVQDNNILEAPTADTYQWVNCESNNEPIEGATLQHFVATTNGTYAVILTHGSCQDTSDCYTVNTTSINELLSLKSIGLYPNPVTDNLEIHLHEKTEIVAIEITTPAGKSIFIREGNRTTLEVAVLPPGLYFLSVHTRKGLWRGKFVKQ